MKYMQKWQGACVTDGVCGEYFDVEVPGNIQYDYAKRYGWGDINYADNCLKYKDIEDCAWIYKTTLEYEKNAEEEVYFVSEGIEYEYDILLNGEKILHHIGMFSRVEANLTELLTGNDLLEVYIYPHPKRAGADVGRQQADQSCKPAVEYGWDWHPRVLVSGLWNETYIETRAKGALGRCEVSYKLSEDMSSALVEFKSECKSKVLYELYDPQDKLLYRGGDDTFKLENVKLWWCAGQGEPSLYRWRVCSESDEKTGRIGFRKVKLVMNGGAWDEPVGFPKSRSNPPVTVELNGRRIFAKGSNYVNPEIFTGRITDEVYEEQIKLVKNANMNMLRCWGGAVVDKEHFFELCDENGIMVWQEFPLACNNYAGTDEYLQVLEQEAEAVIKRLRGHACVVLWCGGNELFNVWSGMTDQSLALRLLNKLCYEHDRNTPFLPTAPVGGMGHGHYVFYDTAEKKSVFELFGNARCTAYSEFGIASIAEMDILKKIIPQEILHKPSAGTAWETHMGFGAWNAGGKDAWLGLTMIDEIFGKQDSVEDYIEKSLWLQSEGLKYVFEEARRQKPVCSMALNWCFNEPWNNAAGSAIVAYPSIPKKSYYAVADSLRDVMPSARADKFCYTGGEVLGAELWYLNDSPAAVEDTVEVYLSVDGEKRHVMTWETGIVSECENKRGHKVQIELPKSKTQKIVLTLEARGGVSEYELLLVEKEEQIRNSNALNI